MFYISYVLSSDICIEAKFNIENKNYYAKQDWFHLKKHICRTDLVQRDIYKWLIRSMSYANSSQLWFIFKIVLFIIFSVWTCEIRYNWSPTMAFGLLYGLTNKYILPSSMINIVPRTISSVSVLLFSFHSFRLYILFWF